jgi:hypothetical protein
MLDATRDSQLLFGKRRPALLVAPGLESGTCSDVPLRIGGIHKELRGADSGQRHYKRDPLIILYPEFA